MERRTLRRVLYTFAHAQSLALCPIQPTGSVCSAAEKYLSGVGQPLSGVSGRQRYNTLDFPKGKSCAKGRSAPFGYPTKRNAAPLWVSCQHGCYSPPLDDPEPNGGRRLLLEITHIFLTNEYPYCKKGSWVSGKGIIKSE